MVDFIADYLTNIRSRRVFPAVQPGYMRNLVPDEAPQEGQPFQEIFKDFERVVLPGVRDFLLCLMSHRAPSEIGESHTFIKACILSCIS